MTLDEIAYNVLNAFRGGRGSQDEYVTIDQIKFNIKHYRAMFIRRDYARNGLVTRHLEQDLRCVKLEQVDASKCCNIELKCPVYRSERQIPRTVRFNFEEAITYVGDVTGHGRIQLINKLLDNNIIDTNKPHHLLGCSLPQEFSTYKNYSWVDSIDTSNPIVHGINDIKYKDYGLDNKVSTKLIEYIDSNVSKDQWNTIEYNINKFREFCT